ncbi:hypothetical protein Agub_g13022, partial [Astrephomene gubernaculifera]
MGAPEAPAGKKAIKPPGKKVDAQALKSDVRAFASQLGLAVGGGGDDAFSDFAPSKAKQLIAPGSKPNKRQRLNDDAKPSRPSLKAAASATHKQQPPATKQAGAGHIAKDEGRGPRNNLNAKRQNAGQAAGKPDRVGHGGGSEEDGDAKKRDWNFGVGPRPGEARGFKSLLGKSDSNIWYQNAAKLATAAAASASASAAGTAPVDPDLFERRRAAAEALMEAEATAFEKELHRRNPSDAKWLLQVKQAGTSTDKLAASTLLVQENVTANMRALDQLVALATKRGGGKELVRQAMEALQELFTSVLLPDRKLKYLEQQPLPHLLPGRDGDKQLLLWWTEDCVKRRYAQFVAALEEHSKDNLDFLKEKAMRVAGELLAAKPECEGQLLSALVNKLGDPSRQVASKAVYLLMQLLVKHPVMKPVVVREVERFLFRPNLADKARYYAVVFLNQVPLSHRASEGGDALAKQLIDLYFTLFRLVVEGHIGAAAQLRKQQEEKYAEEKKKFWKEQRKAAQEGGKDKGRGSNQRKARPPPPPKLAVAEEVDARLLSGLITGVRRAFPYVQPSDVEPLVERSATQLFRMVHTAPFTVAVQALMLMYQLMSARASINDRYYRALYAALDRDGPTTSSRAPMFLALVFKAMQGDVSVKRVAAFAKRLLQLATGAQPNWACGALLLLSQVLAAQPALWASITHPEDVGGSGVEEFKDPAADDEDDGVETFRDQDGSEDEEDGKKKSKAGKGKKAGGEEEEEDAELEKGVKLDLDGVRRGSHALASTSGRGGEGSLAAKAAAATAAAQAAAAEAAWPQSSYYQMDKREPLYANADRSCWWELTALASHAHPSVAAMARSLLCGAPVVFDGDPLRDLSLAAFLDKFVNKKPKPVTRGTSVMQPTAATLAGVSTTAQSQGVKKAAAAPQHASLAKLSSDAFAALAEAEVDSADLFFHKFLNLKGVKDKRSARTDAKTAKKDREEEAAGAKEDSEEALSDADEEEVDRYMDKQEGMVGDALGDPDVGFDYDNLVDAMGEGGGLEDDDDEEAEGGSSGGDDEDMEDGEAEEEDAEEGDSDSDAGGSDDDGSLEGVNILDMPSPSDDDEAEGEEEGGAAGRKKRQRELLASAGLTEADLENLSSGDDDDEEEGVGMEDSGSEDGDEDEVEASSEDEDGDDLMELLGGGSDDDEDMDGDMEDEEGSDEPPQLVPMGGKAGKESAKDKGKKGGAAGAKAKGGSLFADADDYAALIDRAEQEEAEERAKGGDAAKAG